ncbi:MAG: hypothetical protein SNH73_06910 [Rikenellaceae bacterium]
MKSKIKDSHKGTELVAILQGHVGQNINLARIKFIALLLEALCRMPYAERLDAKARSMFRWRP